MPFSDNGPFVANLVGTLAGGDALIGLRSRGDTNRPFIAGERDAERGGGEVPPDRAGAAEASGRHARSSSARCARDPSGGEQANAQAVITPEQRAAIDAARKDIVDTRQQLRAVQFDLNRDISPLETELRIFNIVLVPALLAIAGDRARRHAQPAAREGTRMTHCVHIPSPAQRGRAREGVLMCGTAPSPTLPRCAGEGGFGP